MTVVSTLHRNTLEKRQRCYMLLTALMNFSFIIIIIFSPLVCKMAKSIRLAGEGAGKPLALALPLLAHWLTSQM